MIRITVALVGLAVFGAVFAAIYYDPDNRLQVDTAPAFQLAPGEARQTTIQQMTSVAMKSSIDAIAAVDASPASLAIRTAPAVSNTETASRWRFCRKNSELWASASGCESTRRIAPRFVPAGATNT